MASGTLRPGTPDSTPNRGRGRVVEYQKYIDDQLGRTRRRVKWVDLWTSIALLVTGVVVYLLLSIIVDQWVVPGGLGSTGRWMLLVGLVGCIVVHLVTSLVPFFLRRVNPVYAAAAIERGQPMKNMLINFLLLRKQPDAAPEGVVEALKEQAAVRLSTVPDDAPVDRSMLIRWSYVLVAMLTALVLYAAFSPKDALRSIRRVISPWAEIAAPTRVRIEQVTPGNADRRRDDIVEVQVRTVGVRQGDTVALYVSATGNPVDDVAVPMQSDDFRYLWKATLPAGSEGLKQDLFYHVRAGDAASDHYRIHVLSTPVINVRTVRYDYPDYTGLPPRIVERQGDLKALEGTRVTLTAEANQPIRAAYVAFDQARNKDVELRPDGLTASGGFPLALTKDRRGPLHSSYVLRFVNVDGEENPKAVEHRIDVTADQPPELRIAEPKEWTEKDGEKKELHLPLGGLLRVTLEARDPDFQLAELAVVLDRQGSLMREESLLAEPRYGPYSSTLLLSAERYNLKVGDKFTLRGRAADNKSPKPNVVETPRYTVVVTAPEPGKNPQDNQRQQPNNQKSEQREPAGKQPQPGNPGEQPPQDRNDRQPENQPQPADQQPQQQPADGKSQPAGKAPPQPNEKNQQRGDGKQETGDRKQEAGETGERKQPNDQQSADGQKSPSGEKQPGEKNQQGGKQQEPIDPNVDPARAFEELKKHFDEQQQPPPADGNQKSPPQEEQQQPSQQPPQDAQQQPPGGEKNQQSQPKQSPPKDSEPQQGSGAKSQQPADEKNQQQQGDETSQQQRGGGAQPSGEQKQQGEQRGDEQKSGAPKPAGESARSKQSDEQKSPGNGAKPGDQQPQSNDSQGSGEKGTGATDRDPGERPGEEGMKPQTPSGEKPGDKGEGAKSVEQRPGAEPQAGNPTAPQQGDQSGQGDAGKTGAPPPGGEQKPAPDGTKSGGEKKDEPSSKPSVGSEKSAGSQKNSGGKNDDAPPAEGSPETKDSPTKPRDKTGDPQDGRKQESKGENPKSPSVSEHESDSRSDSSGDRSGKGEDGGGQKSQQKGTGAPGTNTPGDQGASTANEAGDEATSDKPGDKVKASDPSQGKPTGKPGEGRQTPQNGTKPQGEGQNPNDAQPGDRTGEQQDGRPADGTQSGKSPQSKQPPQPSDDKQPQERQNNSNGAARPNDDQDSPNSPPPQDEAGPADEANLDYTKKVTDLTLEKLKHQLDQGQVDPELLKRFTSREALEEFVRKWDAMKQSAQQPGPQGEEARKQFDESLKSLGLRQGSTSQQGARSGGDDFRAVRGGVRSEPPAKYADQYRAYTTGVGQGEK